VEVSPKEMTFSTAEACNVAAKAIDELDLAGTPLARHASSAGRRVSTVMKVKTEEWLLLIGSIRQGEPLPPKVRKFACDVLELVRRGEDPRPFAEIEPRNPREKSNAGAGMLYWLLRAKYGRGGDSAASDDVAHAWGWTREYAKKVGQRCKALKQAALTARELGTLDQQIRAFADLSPNGIRKSRARIPK
jgi:hypothetical protein